MKRILPLYLLLLIGIPCSAQLFKKQEKRPPNALDSIIVNHDFARMYLDSVYNYLTELIT